jgi:hypothetical protein
MCKGDAHGISLGTANNAGRFQMFDFCFCNFKFFWIQAKGFCKNWGMTARVNVMFHPMGWGGHHISRAQNGGEFFEANVSFLQAQNQGFVALQWGRLLMEQKQKVQQPAKRWEKTIWRRLGPLPYKQTVLGWSLEQQ